MIPVTPQPEPSSFDAVVRRRGQNFLRHNAHPSAKQFKKKSFWKDALPELKRAYNGVCAYSAVWVPTSCSVDHFKPKVMHPHLAYEWSNYRLADAKINSNKGNSSVLDPFRVQLGWFILDTAALWIRPEPTLPANVFTEVKTTISTLRLNDDDWVNQRFEIFTDYLNKKVELDFLQRRYPFMASEIVRQNVQPK